MAFSEFDGRGCSSKGVCWASRCPGGSPPGFVFDFTSTGWNAENSVHVGGQGYASEGKSGDLNATPGCGGKEEDLQTMTAFLRRGDDGDGTPFPVAPVSEDVTPMASGFSSGPSQHLHAPDVRRANTSGAQTLSVPAFTTSPPSKVQG